MLECLAPVIDSDATVLILGSMPSTMSLARQQYYGNPRNQFWAILGTVHGEPVSADYGERLAFLRRHRIALWDTLATCERTGSADDRIRNPVPNDVAGLLQEHAGIRLVLLNGQKAGECYRRLVEPSLGGRGVRSMVLPSTSPLNTQQLESKVAEWSRALSGAS